MSKINSLSNEKIAWGVFWYIVIIGKKEGGYMSKKLNELLSKFTKEELISIIEGLSSEYK